MAGELKSRLATESDYLNITSFIRTEFGRGDIEGVDANHMWGKDDTKDRLGAGYIVLTLDDSGIVALTWAIPGSIKIDGKTRHYDEIALILATSKEGHDERARYMDANSVASIIEKEGRGVEWIHSTQDHESHMEYAIDYLGATVTRDTRNRYETWLRIADIKAFMLARQVRGFNGFG